MPLWKCAFCLIKCQRFAIRSPSLYKRKKIELSQKISPLCGLVSLESCRYCPGKYRVKFYCLVSCFLYPPQNHWWQEFLWNFEIKGGFNARLLAKWLWNWHHTIRIKELELSPLSSVTDVPQEYDFTLLNNFKIVRLCNFWKMPASIQW